MTKLNNKLKEGESCEQCGRRSPSYNGWSNYETWCVNLWLTNDQGIYEDIINLGIIHDKARETRNYAGLISEYIEDLKESSGNDSDLNKASLFTDLLNTAMGEVDYFEIAEAFLEEINNQKRINQDNNTQEEKEKEV